VSLPFELRHAPLLLAAEVISLQLKEVIPLRLVSQRCRNRFGLLDLPGLADAPLPASDIIRCRQISDRDLNLLSTFLSFVFLVLHLRKLLSSNVLHVVSRWVTRKNDDVAKSSERLEHPDSSDLTSCNEALPSPLRKDCLVLTNSRTGAALENTRISDDS
jgi:hypothetical protein